MASYNRIIIVGNLTRDPDYKQLSTGAAVCRLGLASNRQYKNRQSGSVTQEVCYIDVDVWGPQAETCRQYLAKGRPVLVEGRLKLDSWQDAEGQNRSKHSIVAERVVFLGSNTAESVESAMSDSSMSSNDRLDELADLAAAPAKTKKAKATTKASPEFSFSDEPPFQDDLPF
jgi:single-strand DNA-binding protein